MTIKEVYEWALRHNCEDSDLIINYVREDNDIVLEIYNLYNDIFANKVNMKVY